MTEPTQLPDGQWMCGHDTCDRVLPTIQGIKTHMARSHIKPADSDALFARVGAATRALFPDGLDFDRIIEVAALQREMLKVISR